MDGIHFSKFLKLARLYKNDSTSLRNAVKSLLANPETAHREIEALDTLEILADMVGIE
jgi:hypothetical protein